MKQQDMTDTQTRFHLNRRNFLAGIGLSSVFFTVRGAFAEQLTLTPAQTEGPYYPDKLPLDLDNDLIIISDAITPAAGAVTWLSGRILDRSGQPVRGALVEIWQADNNGAYIHSRSPSANRDAFFQGYGRFVTGSTGQYVFRTVKPGLYPGRTRHIHFTVTYPGGQKLTTQLYVQGEPINSSDGVLSGIRDTAARNSVIVPFAAVPDSPIGELSAVFDIVLGYTASDAPAGSTPSIFAMNGVLHGASYQPAIAAGSWISIFGDNLGPGARTWNPADIVNGRLPSSLDGVSVTVNNQPAAVYYISPGQVNVEVPSNVSGAAQVTVTNAGGSASTSVDVQTGAARFFRLPAGSCGGCARGRGLHRPVQFNRWRNDNAGKTGRSDPVVRDRFRTDESGCGRRGNSAQSGAAGQCGQDSYRHRRRPNLICRPDGRRVVPVQHDDAGSARWSPRRDGASGRSLDAIVREVEDSTLSGSAGRLAHGR